MEVKTEDPSDFSLIGGSEKKKKKKKQKGNEVENMETAATDDAQVENQVTRLRPFLNV